MRKTACTILLLVTVGLTVSACSPCGFIWDDWRSGKACRSEPGPK